MGRSQTPTAVRKPPGGIPAHKRHQAIVEAMADVPADVEAWVDVSMGLKMQLKDVQQIHDLLAEADESQGHDWQLRILCQGGARPYRVELVVLRAPLMIPPVKKVLEASRPRGTVARCERVAGRPTMRPYWNDIAGPEPMDAASRRIEDLGLSTRVTLALRRRQVRTIEELASHSRSSLLSMLNIGELSVRRIDLALARIGLTLSDG